MMLSNEELVVMIQSGENVQESYEQLYFQNEGLIRTIAKRYVNVEPMEDLMQQAYFGLVAAVENYDQDKGAAFSTYFVFWLKTTLGRYCEECGRTVRVPAWLHSKMKIYSRFKADYEKTFGMPPKVAEIARYMHCSVAEIEHIEYGFKISPTSLDIPIGIEEDFALMDTIASGENLEDDAVNRIYEENQKGVLWGAVEDYTSPDQQQIIAMRFKNDMTRKEIMKVTGYDEYKVRKLEDDGVCNLKRGPGREYLEAKLELQDRLEALRAKGYRGGYRKFKETGTSKTEYLAMERLRIEELYKRVGIS